MFISDTREGWIEETLPTAASEKENWKNQLTNCSKLLELAQGGRCYLDSEESGDGMVLSTKEEGSTKQ